MSRFRSHIPAMAGIASRHPHLAAGTVEADDALRLGTAAPGLAFTRVRER